MSSTDFGQTNPELGEEMGVQIYDGSGTPEDPYVVEFQKDDKSNPMNWAPARKWVVTTIVTLSVFAVTLTSSAYSESSIEVIEQFDISEEVFIVGVSLFVLGFAVGPALWAPLVSLLPNDPFHFRALLTTYAVVSRSGPLSMPCNPLLTSRLIARSELYGRRMPWIVSHIGLVAFIAGSAGSQNIITLLVVRFFAGTFGASPIVNSGGSIADIMHPAQRGLAITLYCVAPFLGPVLGPLIGGFISENVGWRWVQGVCAIICGVIAIAGVIFVPETYGPVVLQQRARKLAKADGKAYISILEKTQGKKHASEVFRKAVIRPWVLLFLEPIVLVGSIYMALTYGIVYMLFAAIPIVFNQDRGWSEGIGGLAFMGLTVGIICGLVYAIVDNNVRYAKLGSRKTAESRLPPAIVGAIAMPVGIFAFAWTNYPSINWAAPIILSSPFGFGCVLIILPIVNYFVDSYTIYAASVLAAAAILRSLLGAVFPLFTIQMFDNLGIHWGASLPGFLTLACLPFPFLMYYYGGQLRMKCKYAHEAAEALKIMQMKSAPIAEEEEKTEVAKAAVSDDRSSQG